VSYFDRQYGNDETNGSSDISVSASKGLTGFATQRVTTSAMPVQFPDSQGNREFYGDYSGLRRACRSPAIGSERRGAGYPETDERSKEGDMPPRGVQQGTKRARQYEHIKESEREQGASEGRAKEIAARTVNKERARSGESRVRSRTSTEDMSSSRRGGQRSGTNREKGRTRDQLYSEAKKLGIEGRSSMNKGELERAVDRRK